MRLLFFLKETFVDAVSVLTSKEGLKSLYGLSLYRNAVYLMLSQLAVALSGFIFWIAAARLYRPEDIGQASAAISATTLLAYLATLGLGYGLVRFLSSPGEKSRALMNSAFLLTGLASLVFSLVFLVGLNFWSPSLNFIRQSPIFMASFVVFTTGMTLSLLFHSTFVARRTASLQFAQNLIVSLTKLILVVVMAKFFAVFGIFASQGLGIAIGVIVSVFAFLPRVEPGYRPTPLFRKGAVNEIVRFSSGNYIADLLWIGPPLILPIMVLNLIGAEDNAYFYIAWAIGTLLGSVGMAVSASLFAEGSFDEAKLRENIRRSLKLVLLLLLPAIILVFLIGDKLLLLFGEVYSDRATHLLWILALASLPMSLNWVYLAVERVRKRLRNIILIVGFIAVVTLVLSYLLLPVLGILGVGIAWISSQGIALLIVLVRYYREGQNIL